MQPVQDDFCYVALLPPELWNYIARFLPWETSEECVQRTEREKDEGFPQEYYKYFGCKNALGVENLVGVFSPDKNKIAVFERFCAGCVNPFVCDNCTNSKLIVVDLTIEQEEDKIIFSEYLSTQYYRALGISCSGNMHAIIKRDKKNKEEASMASHRDYHDVLVLHDRINQRERNFEIPDGFYVSHLMFNKQNSFVIAYARDFRCGEMQKNYLLFDLKVYADTEIAKENKDANNRLLDYLRHYRVCKEIKMS